MGIWCHIEVKHVSDMFQGLGYDTGTVSLILYRAQTEGLARVVGVSRVYGEQQSSHSNQGLALHGKLWKRIENGRRYKKERKGRKSNKVCRKDEESTVL